MARFGRTITKGLEEGFKNVNKFLKRHYIPKSYKFNSMIPLDPNRYFSAPRQNWKSEKNESDFQRFFIYTCIFIFGFSISDILYSLCNNPKQQYRLHLYYPKPTKFVDDLMEDQIFKPWVKLFGKIWVKDYIEFRAFWDQVGKLVSEKKQKQKNARHDEKVSKLKQQYNEMNKKYPVPQLQQKGNVF